MTTVNTSTITPTSDSTQIVNRTGLAIGDQVQSLDDNRNGRVLPPNFKGVPTQVFVRWDDQTFSAADVLRLRRV